MNFILSIFLWMANLGIMVGLVSLALVLLRPVLKRVFTARQRAWVWLAAWFLGYMPMSRITLLPVTFQRIVASRTGGLGQTENAAFLPGSYEGPGAYYLALPGDTLVQVELTDALMKTVWLVWLLGMAALCIFFWRRSKKLTAMARRGRKLDQDDALLAPYPWLKKAFSADVDVWVSPDLPTSFVRETLPWDYDADYEVCLQAELPREQLELVLLHEMCHLDLSHLHWKSIATVNLVLFWWNPLVWLGFRYFCQDQEMACDDEVMEKLEPAKRRQYAETLVELGRGQPLLEVPLAFGECDAEVRVRSVVNWKRRGKALGLLTWCAAIVVLLFFYGGGAMPAQAKDVALAYQREYGGMEAFVQDLNDDMASELGWSASYVDGRPCYPDLGIVQVWEGPVERLSCQRVALEIREGDSLLAPTKRVYVTQSRDLASLWVNTADGAWYQVFYEWRSVLLLERVEACEAPDLTGRYQLVG